MIFVFFFKQKTAYEMRISDWSSDVCSSDLAAVLGAVEDVGGGTTNDRPSGEPFGPTGPRSPSPRIHREGEQDDPGDGQDHANRQPITQAEGDTRSEERRVGKECGSTCSSWWSP